MNFLAFLLYVSVSYRLFMCFSRIQFGNSGHGHIDLRYLIPGRIIYDTGLRQAEDGLEVRTELAVAGP